MNDNFPPHVVRPQHRMTDDGLWLEEVQELRTIGVRAVAKPESLTMGEIQEIAWGFLMAAGTLEEMASRRS